MPYKSLDVFSIANGETNWLGCVGTLDEAIKLLSQRGEGSYAVFSQQTRGKEVYDVSADGVVTRSALE